MYNYIYNIYMLLWIPTKSMDPQGIQPGGFGGRTLQPAPVGGWLSEVSENCWLPQTMGFLTK